MTLHYHIYAIFVVVIVALHILHNTGGGTVVQFITKFIINNTIWVVELSLKLKRLKQFSSFQLI